MEWATNAIEEEHKTRISTITRLPSDNADATVSSSSHAPLYPDQHRAGFLLKPLRSSQTAPTPLSSSHCLGHGEAQGVPKVSSPCCPPDGPNLRTSRALGRAKSNRNNQEGLGGYALAFCPCSTHQDVFCGVKTKNVRRRDLLARKRYTLASCTPCADSHRLIGPKGTMTTSGREIRG